MHDFIGLTSFLDPQTRSSSGTLTLHRRCTEAFALCLINRLSSNYFYVLSFYLFESSVQ